MTESISPFHILKVDTKNEVNSSNINSDQLIYKSQTISPNKMSQNEIVSPTRKL